MTIAERNNKLKHFITCLKCEVSGKPCDVNCSTQYDAGNMGEIIENLEAISRALEQETILDKIRAEVEALNQDYYCEGDFDKCKDYVLDILDEYRGYSSCDDCEHEGSFGKEFDDTCMKCKSGSNRIESR